MLMQAIVHHKWDAGSPYFVEPVSTFHLTTQLFPLQL